MLENLSSLMFLQINNLMVSGQIDKIFENEYLVYFAIGYALFYMSKNYKSYYYSLENLYYAIRYYNVFNKSYAFEYSTNGFLDGSNFNVIQSIVYYYIKNAGQDRTKTHCKVSSTLITDENQKQRFGGEIVPLGTVYCTYKDQIFKIYSSYKVHDTQSGGNSSRSYRESTIYICVYGPTNKQIEEFIQFCIEDRRNDINNMVGDKIQNVKKNSIFYPKIEANKLKYRKYKYDNKASFDKIFLNQKKELINHINKFKDPDYTKLNKMSFLLHGPPGTGKTTFARTLAAELNLSIIFVKPSEIENVEQLFDIFYAEKIETTDNCFMTLTRNNKLIVFEDIDAECPSVLRRECRPEEEKKEENGTTAVLENLTTAISSLQPDKKDTKTTTKPNEKSKLNLSDILQVFDGIITNEGIVTVMTTNHREKLDPALIRPGRVTMDIELNTLNLETSKEMIASYFPDEDLTDVNIHGLKPSVLENMCYQAETLADLKVLYKNHTV